MTSVARSGDNVPGVGVINSISFFPPQVPPGTTGRGVLKGTINASGQFRVHIDVPSIFVDFDEAILTDTLGLDPYIAEGVEGFLDAPTPTYVITDFHRIAMADSGDAIIVAGLIPDEFSTDAPTSAILWNTGAVVAQEGQPAVAAGLAPGSVWGPFAAGTTWADVNNSGQVLVVSSIVESGMTKVCVIRIDTDGAGGVTGATLLGKVGGGVPGHGVWTSIASTACGSALSDDGTAIFSGSTSNGTEGVYQTGPGGSAFVAVRGGPTPVPGLNWGALAGSAVDLNNTGQYALRGLTGDGSGTWTEVGDAGEQTEGADGLATLSANRTFGNGPLNTISGALSGSHDVDLYRIRATTTTAFSATTVPSAGFDGANFDTVLTLIRSPGSGTRGIFRCDDVSAGVMQSTIQGTLPAVDEYYLAVSMRTAAAAARQFNYATQTTPTKMIWEQDPAGLAVHNGVLYWADHTSRSIRRATTAGAPFSPDLGTLGLNAAPALAVRTGVNVRLYWNDRGASFFRRTPPDGSIIEDIYQRVSFLGPATGDVSGLAIDNAGGKFYWTRPQLGEICRANLPGGSPEVVVRIPTEFQAGVEGFFEPDRIAVDSARSRLYWVNPKMGVIQRSNLDGTNMQTFAVAAGAADLAVDATGAMLYWTIPGSNVIRRSSLTGDGSETANFVVTATPTAIAVDGAGGMVYWSDPSSRTILKAAVASPSPAVVLSIGPDTGVRNPDGPAAANGFTNWIKSGPPDAVNRPYQVRLTGAAFLHEGYIIERSGQKVVAVGDSPNGIAGESLADIGKNQEPIVLNDLGEVLYHGMWYEPTIFINVIQSGLFLGNELILRNSQIPAGFQDKIIFFWRDSHAYDMSKDGRFAMILANMQDPPFNFTIQRDNALRLEFERAPLCPCDWNQVDGLDSQDFFDFLNDFFLGDADINGMDGTDSQDYFDFIDCFFTGCP